ncbi:GNAT family N-acetyltransferase [Plantibacter sp. YIM 135249]|uniref:GNAT family N-acetyltransferase n=1 Tax=Plantibacter sp. YIM 135249 TaxID=3423918 RepID=UPI003D346D8B
MTARSNRSNRSARPMRSWRPNVATSLFGIENPIVLGPFGGLSSVELTAIVSERGGLGSFGLYGYDRDRIRETWAALRARTAKPINLNLWLPLDGDQDIAPDDAAYDAFVEVLRPYFDEVGLEPPARPARYLPSFEEQFQAVLDARPEVLSFVFGVPSAEVIARAHDAGIIVVGTATTVDEAIALEAGGVDAVTASGQESGGHRVSFLRPAEESLIGTFSLVPQVRDAVSVPVVAAGGIADGRGVAAALTLGADAVQIGSAFLATSVSAASSAHRDALRSADARRTVLTRVMSGRLARGIPNRVVRELEERLHTEGSDALAPFPVQNWLTGRFRAAATTQDRRELLSLWAGQSSPLIATDDADELIDTVLGEAGRILPDRLLPVIAPTDVWSVEHEVRTERLVLRPHRASDLDDMLAFHSDPEVTRYLPWPVRDRTQTRAALDVRLGQGAARREGEWLVFAMEVAETSTVIGEVLLKRADDANGVGELGYAMHRDHHGLGLAREATEAMLELAWNRFGLAQVVAYVDPRNTASSALLERLGFSRALDLDVEDDPERGIEEPLVGFRLFRP